MHNGNVIPDQRGLLRGVVGLRRRDERLRLHRRAENSEIFLSAPAPGTQATPLRYRRRPPGPPEVRHALATIDHAVADYVTYAHLGAAA